MLASHHNCKDTAYTTLHQLILGEREKCFSTGYLAKNSALFFPVLSDWSQMHTTSWWRGIFENKRRFLFLRYPYTKTSLSFTTSIKFWNIQLNLCSLFFVEFKYSIFSCFSVHFLGHILIDWRWIFTNQESFLSITDPFTITSLRFYTGVTNWEIWKLLWHLFSINSPYLPGIRFAIFSKLVELVS